MANPDLIAAEDPTVKEPNPDSISGLEVSATRAARAAFEELSPEQRQELRRSRTVVDLRGETIQAAFASKATNAFDRDQEAQFMERASRYPANVAMEARKYWVVKPHLDFDYIVKNLASIRAEVQSENYPWEMVRDQHPVLHKYLSDPTTAALAMQDTAMLTGADRWLGGVVEPVGGDQRIDPKTGQIIDSKTFQVAPPFWARMAVDAFTKDIPHLAAGAAFAVTDFLQWSLPSTHIDAIEDARKTQVKYWEDTWRRLGRETTGAKDYLGPKPDAAWYTPERMARSMENGVGFISRNLPILIGAALSGGGAAAAEGALATDAALIVARTKGVFLFNTAYSAADLYPRVKEQTESSGIAAGLTVAGAPLLGKIMGWSPVSNAAGAAMYRTIETGVGKAAAKALESQSWRSLTRIAVMKAGADYGVGKFAFAAQGAASAGVDQLSLVLAGKEADMREINRAFVRGWEDGDAAVLLSVFGTGRQIVADTGRAIRAKEMGRHIEGLREQILKATQGDPAFQEQALKEIASQPGRDSAFRLPLERFNEVVTKAGWDPRKVAAEIHGDKGEAYDKAVADHSEHLTVPVEKMRTVFESKILDEFARSEGTLDPTVWSRVVSQKISDEFKVSFDAALKVKPGEMDASDKPIYDALVSFAKSDENVAQHLFATVKALGSRHPTLTAQEIFDATFGKGGLYGPPREGQINTSIEPYKNGLNPHLVYSHDRMPEKLHVDFDVDITTGKPTWVVGNFDFPQGEYQKAGGREALAKKFGGQGMATDIYMAALKDAQKAGVAWSSDVTRTDATINMYARLRKYGIPFTLIDGPLGEHYHLSAEALASVDFTKIEQRRAELNVDPKSGSLTDRGAYGMAAPAEQALRLAIDQSGVYGSKEWMEAFKTEQAAFDHTAMLADMTRLARERVEMAIKAGVRAQVSTERAKFEAQAREEIKNDSGQRAAHFFQTGELWGDAARRAMMIGPDGKPLRLLASEVDALMGKGAAEAIKDAKRGIITDDPRKAIDIDAAANALGYEGSSVTGEAARKMVVGIRDSLTDGQFVKEWAEVKMQEALRSDLLDNPQALVLRVMDSVQNEKVAQILIQRLRAAGNALDPMRQARAKLPPEAWEQIARGIVMSKVLGDLRPEQYIRAMKTSADRALEALRAGKTDRAWDATEAQLLNHYLYRISRENDKALGTMLSRLTEQAASDSSRAMMGKADPAYRNLNDALLGVVGIADRVPVEGVLEKFREQVVLHGQDTNLAADAAGGWSTEVVASVLSGDKKWEDLRPAEAAEVFKAIKNIRHIAKIQNEALKVAGAARVDDMIAGAERHLSGLAPGVQGPSIKGRYPVPQDTNVEAKTLVGALKDQAASMGWSGAYLDSPRVILGYLGKELQDGLYMDGFMGSRVKERQLLNDLYFPWKETQKIWENDPDFHKPLIGAEDSLRIAGLDGPLSKKYLVQMLKWLGSESGREKLLKGMGVHLDAVLTAAGRYLQPHELDAIQAEHKFFDQKLAPLKAEQWERQKGLPWEKVKPLGYEITFADGTTRQYEGGYYPIHWDKREGVSREYIPVEPDSASLYNPKVPDGSFKERTKYVGVPDLNWANIPAHLLGDVHNLAFSDFVQDANRVLLNPRMLNVIRRHLGEEYAAWPRAWLNRVANESAGHAPGHLDGINAALRYTRSTVVTGALGFNLPLLAGDMAHPMATATIRDGIAMSVTYAGPSMTRVLESAANGMITGADPMREEILGKSAIVKLREDELPSIMSRWLHGTYERSAEPGFLESTSRVRDAIQNTSFWHLRVSDGLITRMIWDAKYRHVLDQTGDEMAARRAGDEQVLAAMPDYSVMATPSILAEKSSIHGMTLIFHSYWSKLLEMADEQRHQMIVNPTKPGGRITKSIMAAQWAGRTLGMLTFAVVMGDFLQGRGKQEDEDWLTWTMRKELSAPLKLFPYANQLLEPTVNAWASDRGSKAQDVEIRSPFFAPYERAMTALNLASFDHQRSDADKVFGLVTAALMLTGLPSNAPGRATRYGYELAFGDEDPRGSLDVLSGFTYGRKYGRASRYNLANPLIELQTMFEKGQ